MDNLPIITRGEREATDMEMNAAQVGFLLYAYHRNIWPTLRWRQDAGTQRLDRDWTGAVKPLTRELRCHPQ